jgi:hypothetical protein
VRRDDRELSHAGRLQHRRHQQRLQVVVSAIDAGPSNGFLRLIDGAGTVVSSFQLARLSAAMSAVGREAEIMCSIRAFPVVTHRRPRTLDRQRRCHTLTGTLVPCYMLFASTSRTGSMLKPEQHSPH